jgi:hypothetical protein
LTGSFLERQWKYIVVREVIGFCEGPVPEPDNGEAGLIAGKDFNNPELKPDQ